MSNPQNLTKIMGSLANYFNYKAFARELFNWDYNMGPNLTPSTSLNQGIFRKNRPF